MMIFKKMFRKKVHTKSTIKVWTTPDKKHRRIKHVLYMIRNEDKDAVTTFVFTPHQKSPKNNRCCMYELPPELIL